MPPLRFVILRHDAPAGVHYDVMLESSRGDDPKEKVLRTWATLKDEFPSPFPGCALRALADHRRHYLTHEGDIGGGRGTVARVDEGVWRLETEDERGLVVHLEGTRLHGTFYLRRPAGLEKTWRLEHSGVPDA